MRFKDLVFTLEKKLDRLLGAYDEKLPVSHNALLAELSARCGIEIVTEHTASTPAVSYLEPDERQKRICADLLMAELSIYPKEILAASRLERIICCSKLSSYGCAVAGLAQMGLLVVDSIYLDADRIGRNWDYARKAFHHELFHAIDFHEDLLGYIDPTWNDLNPPGFNYQLNRRFHEGFNEPSDSPGFLSSYAKTSVHEDKAELYCHLIVFAADVQKRTESDPFLAGKIARLKDLLARFCDKFDSEFWQTIDVRSRQLKVRKHSDWSAALSTHHKQLLASKRLQPDSSQPSRRLTLDTQVKNGRRIWRASMRLPGSGREEQVSTFYTYNKLCAFLRRSGITQTPGKDELLSRAMTFTLEPLE